MRAFLLFLPLALLAQTPAPKSQPTALAPPKPAAAAPRPPAAGGTTLTGDDEKIVYAIGLSMARSLGPLNLSPTEVELVKKAISDSLAGKPAEDLATWGPRINGLAQSRTAATATKEKIASKAYLEKAAAEPGAVKTPSGLIYREVKAGAGPSPKATDTVKVNYRGTLTNGTEFDKSPPNQPVPLSLNGVIPCWTEGVQKMKVGGKSVLICPSEIAYGDGGQGPIPGGAALIFEIELVQIGDAKK
jgi:FKBP-type peptidyl-prolyl cis-trans isomerase FkpA